MSDNNIAVAEQSAEVHAQVPQAPAPTFDKERWLTGPSDIEEVVVYVESLDTSVRLHGLTAGQQARIQDQCMTIKGSTSMKIDALKMGVLKWTYGVIEPKFDENEANVIAQKYGQAFTLVVDTIDELSKASEEDVAAARSRFRPHR
jgi:hypothetical protein